MNTRIFKFLFVLAISVFAYSADALSNVTYSTGTTTYAAPVCNFTRDLGEGMGGEDVRCLQAYLISSGVVAGYMVPDGIFGPMTRQAVMQWQAMKGLPVTGYFEAMSRAKYFEHSGGVIGGPYPHPVPGPVISSQEEKARVRMEEAMEMIDEAIEQIEDCDCNTSSAEASLEEALMDMYDSVREFFVEKDFRKAYNKADDAHDNAEEAYEKAGGDNDEDAAEDAIDDAKEAIDDAKDAIEDADDDGHDVNDAENLLEDAEDLFDEAEEEFDDEDYDEAEELAREAEELAQDAIDAIN